MVKEVGNLWRFDSSSWEQDDVGQAFKVKNLFGQESKETFASVALLDILVNAKKHPHTSERCGLSLYPSDFTYCPFCGTKLEINNPSAKSWIPPYGSGNGLKVLTSTFAPDSGSYAGEIFDLPAEGAGLAFCSLKLGGQSRLLVALQREIGKLWVYCQDKKKWLFLDGVVQGDSLPIWSWTPATDSAESGLLVPTDQGPTWLTVNWASGVVQADRFEGRSVGGAARLGKYLLAPVQRGEELIIVGRTEGGAAWVECAAPSDKQIISNLTRMFGQANLKQFGQAAFFGVPVVDENRRIAYWPCRRGYVQVIGGDSSTLPHWEYRPWETDEFPAEALVELGPPYRQVGGRPGFFQLCEDKNDDSSSRDEIVYKLKKFGGDEHLDSKTLECGQFLTTGRASFSWGDDFWNDVHQRDARLETQSELRFPLLQFGEKSGMVLIAKIRPWVGRDEFGVFTDTFFDSSSRVGVFVRFVIEGSGVPEMPLFRADDENAHDTKGSLFSVTLAHVPEISAFIYGDFLHIYLPEKGECIRWRISLTEAM